MKYFILFLISLLLSCSSKYTGELKTNTKQCDIIIEILEIEKIDDYIKKFTNNRSIRITDKANLLKGTTWCAYNVYSVRIENNYLPDLNTGKFIDIIVTSYKNTSQNTKEVSILFSPHTASYRPNYIISGKISIQKKDNNKWEVAESKFSIVD